jgi:ABC-type dipeptide/oligopeptide/nickel transport systems, permease components
MALSVGEFGLPPGPEQIEEQEPVALEAIKGRSLGAIAWRRLRQDKVAMAGGVIAVLLILVAIFAKYLCAWYGKTPNASYPNLLDPSTTMPMGSLGGISGTHWLGLTPVNGNDVLAQLIYGLRTSLIIGVLATVLSLVLGLIFGTLAGYFGGFSDTLIARGMDLLLSFPTLLFSIALLTIFANVSSFAGLSGEPLRYAVIIFVLGFFGFAYIGRIVRGQVLSLRENDFVAAARGLGATSNAIMVREIWPNLVGPVLVWTTLTIPNYILGEAALSYLGVGILPPSVSLGGMLSTAGTYLQVDPTDLFCPGVTIFVLVLAFNLFGDGLRDALDPKSMR